LARASSAGAAHATLGNASLEALDASAGIHELLPSGVKRVALGADLEVVIRAGGAGGELIAARAAHVRNDVLGVDLGFHGSPMLAAG
jgi:hypothetical protein